MDAEVETVVNNAGYGLFGEAIDLDRAQQLAMVDLNVRVLTELTLRFADSIVRHRGGILNVASIASFLPGPRMAVYYATKAYVLSFTEAMRGELGRKACGSRCVRHRADRISGRCRLQAGAGSAVLNLSAAAVARAGYRGLMSTSGWCCRASVRMIRSCCALRREAGAGVGRAGTAEALGVKPAAQVTCA